MNNTDVQYPDYAFIKRGDRPDVVAGRSDDLIVECPQCHHKDDVAFLASNDVLVDRGMYMRDIVAWCPCGCVFVVDKAEPVMLYSFFTHKAVQHA